MPRKRRPVWPGEGLPLVYVNPSQAMHRLERRDAPGLHRGLRAEDACAVPRDQHSGLVGPSPLVYGGTEGVLAGVPHVVELRREGEVRVRDDALVQ